MEVDIFSPTFCNELIDTQATPGTPLADTRSKAAKPNIGASKRHAFLVASGIFLSRLAGLVRESVFAHYFGSSDAADAFKAAFRIPNLLQTLFGQGVLSASFIPVYAGLLAQDDEEEAGRTAGAVAGLLALSTSILVVLGILATPYLIDLIAPGFHGAKRQLTIHLVQILFPGAGLLVFSAWCLGVLNSHKKFFLSYAVPVVWNAAMIATMFGWGSRYHEYRLAIILAWGSVVGSGLQVAIQLPVVLKVMHRLRISLNYQTQHVKEVIVNSVPVFIGRGVVQISAYVDAVLASLLPTGAVASLAYAQLLFMLPVSLFGMSVSAAELPHMSGVVGTDDEVAPMLRARLNSGLRQIAFFVVPSIAALLVLGDVIIAAIYKSGRFTQNEVIYVWGIVAGAMVGLLASTLGRLYSSTYYALHDTRTPLRYAIIRVILTSGLGYFFAIPLPHILGIEARWGVAGLTISAGIASWVEFTLLRGTLNRRIGRTGVPAPYLAKLWAASFAAAGLAWLVHHYFRHHSAKLAAVVVLTPFGMVYFAATLALGLSEVRVLLARFMSAANRAR